MNSFIYPSPQPPEEKGSYRKVIIFALLILLMAIGGFGYLAYNGYFKSVTSLMCGSVNFTAPPQVCTPTISVPACPDMTCPACPVSTVNVKCLGNSTG